MIRWPQDIVFLSRPMGQLTVHTRSRNDRLRSWREEAGLTQQGLSEISGINRSHIARFERGGRPADRIAIRLAEVLSTATGKALSKWDLFDDLQDDDTICGALKTEFD